MPESKCRKCSAILADDGGEGVCPKCLLAQALELPEEPLTEIGSSHGSLSEISEAVIGRYKLIRKIGEGGLGVVYMAEQLEPVRRRVAVKLIKPGMDSREVVARFEGERQALALMNHPNIAKVFDGGSTPGGRPYFVMEWVQGIKITDFCDENQYSIEQRFELFIQVCLGIQHAHQKGVIHRDIKPSNILISINDGVPTPKMIDFGIAKATERRLTGKTVYTQYNQFLGTPTYMSPEQALMKGDIDTRSDIYSLGVLLYELLVGRTPFRTKALADAGLDEMRRIVREDEPPRPSECLRMMEPEELMTAAAARGIDPVRFPKRLRGDPDWIVARCLEKERNRRYETADALASDIHRHLRHEPITASSPSRLYLLRKTVRRNKLVCGAAVAIAAALMTGTTVSMLMFLSEREARREQGALRQNAEENEKKARTETTKSEQVARFLKDMLKGVGPRVSLGRDTRLLSEILDETAKRLQRDLFAEPEVQADLLETLGNVYVDLGHTVTAESIFRDTLALRRGTLGSNHTQVARSLNYLGDLLRGGDRLNEAEALHREALVIQRQALAEHPDIAETLHLLGWALARQMQLGEAETVHREALALRRKFLGETHFQVAESLHYTGEALEAQDKLPASEALFMQALAIHAGAADRSGLPHIQQHLGRVLEKQGRFDDGEAFYRQALEVQRSLVGDPHPDVARSLRELGAFLSRRGKSHEGESALREALEMFRGIFGQHREVVQTLEDLAKVLANKGDRALEAEVWREIVNVERAIPGKEVLKLPQHLGKLGAVLEDLGALPEAEAAYREAFILTSSLLGKDQWMAITTGIRLGRVLERTGKVAEAEMTYAATLDRFHKVSDVESGRVLNAISWLLATCNMCSIRDGASAVRLAARAVEKTRSAENLAALAAAYAESGDFAKATGIQQQAIDLLGKGLKARQFAQRLALYRAQQPVRDP